MTACVFIDVFDFNCVTTLNDKCAWTAFKVQECTHIKRKVQPAWCKNVRTNRRQQCAAWDEPTASKGWSDRH